MKNTKKRGFTIVELVIVIAVIAILAAVLIPTFSNVIASAKKSNELQTARNAWTNWLAATPENISANQKATLCIHVDEYVFHVDAGVFDTEAKVADGHTDTANTYTVKYAYDGTLNDSAKTGN